MDTTEKIKKRYYDLIGRSFSTKLETFLFSRCVFERNIGNFSFYDLKWFSVTDELEDLYLKAWNLGKEDKLSEDGLTMGEIDGAIEKWTKKNAELKSSLFEEYRTLFITDLFPFGEFEKFYDSDPSKRICHYCGISDKDIEDLENIGQIRTKRDRGFSMEIDRIKPNREYLKDNIVLSCYWCNNAKSDEFTEPEFVDHVGPAIREIWDSRRKRI